MLFCFVGPVYNSPKPVLGRCCDVWKELINLHHLARMCWGLGSSIKGHWAPAWSPPLGALSFHLCSTTLKFDFSWCWGSVHFAFLFGWWQLVRVSGASCALCCHLGEVCFPVIASYFNSIAMVVLDTESARTCALWKHIDAIICIYEKLSMLSENVTSTRGFASSLAGRRCSCPSCQVVCTVIREWWITGRCREQCYSPVLPMEMAIMGPTGRMTEVPPLARSYLREVLG